MKPITREERLMNAAAGGGASGIKPITREEQFLAYAAGESDTKPTPITRREMFLDKIEGGGGGTTDPRLNKIIDRTIASFSDDKIETIGAYAFAGCSNLTEVNTPEVTTIGDGAFQECPMLENINLPKLTTLGGGAFTWCEKITKIDFPFVTTLTSRLFGEDGTGIVYVKLLSLASLPTFGAFEYGYNLKVLELGQPVNFPMSCFSGCSSFDTLIMRNTTISTMFIPLVFMGSPFAEGGTGGICLVPRSLITEYQNATNWSVLYAAGTCLFWALEDYTVDGTITGEVDWDKLNTDREGAFATV